MPSTQRTRKSRTQTARTAPTLLMGLAALLISLACMLSACGGNHAPADAFSKPREGLEETSSQPDPASKPPAEPASPQHLAPSEDQAGPGEEQREEPNAAPVIPEYEMPENSYDAVEVVAEPASITVLVNKKYALPKDYVPDDLVEPNVPFIFKEKLEKRKLRKEAAEALEALFAAAKEDGILLAGVSGYRSYNTQKGLYNAYVERDGREAADRYSARPGHSEHSTGLAMDVSGIDGKCAATDCFADTPEAKWLAEHAYDYGFIIRYPEGKEDITGYKYEPWHLRYVGVDAAREIRDLGVTLEEYTAMRAAMAAGGEPPEEGAAAAGGTNGAGSANAEPTAPDEGEWPGTGGAGDSAPTGAGADGPAEADDSGEPRPSMRPAVPPGEGVPSDDRGNLPENRLPENGNCPGEGAR